jgi:hypothetical protein
MYASSLTEARSLTLLPHTLHPLIFHSFTHTHAHKPSHGGIPDQAWKAGHKRGCALGSVHACTHPRTRAHTNTRSNEVGDRAREGRAYGNLGCPYHSQGDYSKAIECRRLQRRWATGRRRARRTGNSASRITRWETMPRPSSTTGRTWSLGNNSDLFHFFTQSL